MWRKVCHASGQQLPKGRSERKLSGSIFGVDSGVASLKAMCSPTSASCANKTDQKGRKKKKNRTLVDHRCKYIANNNEFEKKAPFEARVSGFLPTLTSKLQVIYARIPYVFPHFIQKSWWCWYCKSQTLQRSWGRSDHVFDINMLFFFETLYL